MTPTLTHWNGKPIAEINRADFVDMVRSHGKIGAAGGALVSPEAQGQAVAQAAETLHGLVKGAQQAGRLSAIHSVHMLPGAAGALTPTWKGGDRTSPPVADEDESQARHAGGRS